MKPDTKRREVPGQAARDAQTRAAAARQRAARERQAAQRATTEYARRAHQRVADMHTELAQSHEDSARRLRVGGTDPQEA